MARHPRRVESDDRNAENAKNTLPPQIVLGSTPVRPFSAVNLGSPSPSPFGDRWHMAHRPQKIKFDDRITKNSNKKTKGGKKAVDGKTKVKDGKGKAKDDKGEAKD